jgi:phosphatidylserine decarboxylase precursor
MYKKYLKYNEKIKKIINEYNANGGNIYNLNGDDIIEPTTFKQTIGIWGQKQLIKLGLNELITYHLTKNTCKKMGENENIDDIVKFAENYEIDYKTMKNCSEEKTIKDCLINTNIHTMNDFFIRQKDNLPDQDKLSLDLMSPVDCYATMFLNEIKAKKLWIKGKLFTLKKLFNLDISNNYGIIIFRLAPHHYHRFHCPVNGRIISINKIGTKFLSVQPSIVKISNVYTENVRVNITIQTNNDSILYLSIIGATCIGSIVISNINIVKMYNEHKNIILNNILFNDIDMDDMKDFNNYLKDNIVQIYQNDELGYFQYGGSTIVCAYDNNKFDKSFTIGNILYDRTLIGQHETEIKVGDKILLNKK